MTDEDFEDGDDPLMHAEPSFAQPTNLVRANYTSTDY